jgi:hypothetical protein
MRNLITALRSSRCRKCGSGYVVRSHRNAFEQVVSAVGIFPYQCDACGERFSLFGARRGRPSEEETEPGGPKPL